MNTCSPRPLLLGLAALTVLAAGSLALTSADAAQVTRPAPSALEGTLGSTNSGPVLSLASTQAGDQIASPGVAVLPLTVRVFGSQHGQPVTTTSKPVGYGPAQLRSYLKLHGAGAHETVDVIGAFDDSYLVGDVNTFSSTFGLSKVCGTPGADADCFHLTVAHPYGFAGSNPSWALEVSLDVETIHAIAPDATVRLIEAYDNQVDSLFRAVDFARASSPAVISNSWGTNSEFTDENRYDKHCALANSVCVFSSGDFGNPAGYPATSPDVLAVGGTSLQLSASGAVQSEVAWSESGGGISSIEKRPSYQAAVLAGRYRGTPDVSFDADPYTGVPVYTRAVSGTTGHWFQVGGTSLGAPAWSAILAVVDGERAAKGQGALTAADFELQRTVYGLTRGIGDITEGANGPTQGCADVCQAHRGYDTVTGVGSPRRGIDSALVTTSGVESGYPH